MDRGVWWATVNRFVKSQTQLRQLSARVRVRGHTHTHTHTHTLLNYFELHAFVYKFGVIRILCNIAFRYVHACVVIS